MRTTRLEPEDFAASVVAVPPLCRTAALGLAAEENLRLVRHLEAGGIRILLYGGNANLYNSSPSEFGAILDLIEGIAGEDTTVVPSVGPFFGTSMDQAAVLRGRRFPTAMVLPVTAAACPDGVMTGLRRFAERADLPIVLYLKDEAYLAPRHAARLVDDGLVSWIKYALVRPDPAEDPFLEELLDLVPRERIVSGIGEQPAPTHLLEFGLAGFTSGCVCVRPDLSTAVRAALRESDRDTADRLLATFRPLEDLRNAHGPIPVLHHAVAAAGIAETGPLIPLLALPTGQTAEAIATAAKDLAGAR